MSVPFIQFPFLTLPRRRSTFRITSTLTLHPCIDNVHLSEGQKVEGRDHRETRREKLTVVAGAGQHEATRQG
jgi:hypothetical protein